MKHYRFDLPNLKSTFKYCMIKNVSFFTSLLRIMKQIDRNSGKRLENKTHLYAMESPSDHHATIQRQLESTII